MKYLLDINRSEVSWAGSQSKHLRSGTVFFKEGFFIVKNGIIEEGKAIVDMTSITVVDDKMEIKEQEELEDIIKSGEFFNVPSFPEATFKIERILPDRSIDNKYSHIVEGELTLRDVTNQLKFPVLLELDGEKMEAQSKFAINRTHWNINYMTSPNNEEDPISPEIFLNFYIICLPVDEENDYPVDKQLLDSVTYMSMI